MEPKNAQTFPLEALHIEATKYTPTIHFDPISHTHEIRGESYPENTSEFYAPVMKWLETYLSQLSDQDVCFSLEIIYFNSSSSKILMDFFDMLNESCKQGKNIHVDWIYDAENESALEYGEEFKEDLAFLPFNLVEK